MTQRETFEIPRPLVDKIVQVLGGLPWNQVAQLMGELGMVIQKQQDPGAGAPNAVNADKKPSG